MAYVDIKSSIKDVRWRLMVFCVLLMLASDSFKYVLNRNTFWMKCFNIGPNVPCVRSPVKVVCSILTLSPAWISVLSVVAMLGIMAANFNELLYFFLKVGRSLVLFNAVTEGMVLCHCCDIL